VKLEARVAQFSVRTDRHSILPPFHYYS